MAPPIEIGMKALSEKPHMKMNEEIRYRKIMMEIPPICHLLKNCRRDLKN
jgi:hypothetical protein